MPKRYYVDKDGKVYCTACASDSIIPREMVTDHGFIREDDNTCRSTYVCPNCKNVIIESLSPENGTEQG